MQTTYADTNDSIVGPDGLTREQYVVFIKRHEDKNQNSASLESGAFLPICPCWIHCSGQYM